MFGVPLYMLIHDVLDQGLDVLLSDEVDQLQYTCHVMDSHNV